MWRLALLVTATLSSGLALSASGAPSGLRIRGPCKAGVLEPCSGSEHRVLRALMLRGGEGSQEKGYPGNATSRKLASLSVDDLCTLLSNETGFRALPPAEGGRRSKEQVAEALFLMSLRNLAENAENRVAIAAKGGIEAVVGAMGVHGSSAGVQEAGCRALGNLAYNVENQGSIAAKGGIEAVVGAMGAHELSEAVQEAGCSALITLRR